ncbi:hypothetical protein HZS_2749 [Henneguya salminicola]|uniref:Glucose-induced degradation protein 8 homolog (Trinotate prediction) n=1 Tax=Henneguya salminicola TaxID=69463 RepID=A0A6G3MG35_HENSL|nr:hypothetical protein HZS_2749 [Henneguya salminicola]
MTNIDFAAVVHGVNDAGLNFYKDVGKLISSYNIQENILYFLIEMGLGTAVNKFLSEGTFCEYFVNDTKATEVYKSLQYRSEVVSAIFDTNSARAIDLINHYFPDLINNRPLLHMKLLLLQLGSLIRARDIPSALDYCQGPIGSLFNLHPECLCELKKYTFLMISPDPFNSRNSYLLSPSRLHTVAREVSHDIIKYYQPNYQFHELIDSIRLYEYSKRYSEVPSCTALAKK